MNENQNTYEESYATLDMTLIVIVAALSVACGIALVQFTDMSWMVVTGIFVFFNVWNFWRIMTWGGGYEYDNKAHKRRRVNISPHIEAIIFLLIVLGIQNWVSSRLTEVQALKETSSRTWGEAFGHESSTNVIKMQPHGIKMHWTCHPKGRSQSNPTMTLLVFDKAAKGYNMRYGGESYFAKVESNGLISNGVYSHQSLSHIWYLGHSTTGRNHTHKFVVGPNGEGRYFNVRDYDIPFVGFIMDCQPIAQQYTGAYQ